MKRRMNGQAMLDRVARYPAWLAIAMMAPLVGLVVVAAVAFPSGSCRHARSLTAAGLSDARLPDRVKQDGARVLVVLDSPSMSARTRYRLIRIVLHSV